jgi:hypothetical protein
MPEPGQTPQPMFKGLPYGENVEANEADIDDELFGDDEDDYTPAGAEEEFLLGPTDRPDEPLTAGVGFGPGADATRFAVESDGELLGRVAERIIADPAADPQAKAWAAKRAKGL